MGKNLRREANFYVCDGDRLRAVDEDPRQLASKENQRRAGVQEEILALLERRMQAAEKQFHSEAMAIIWPDGDPMKFGNAKGDLMASLKLNRE